ncbi:hypothetical protein pb186bvf_017505 [Paramecium bursaria]
MIQDQEPYHQVHNNNCKPLNNSIIKIQAISNKLQYIYEVYLQNIFDYSFIRFIQEY